MAAGGPPAARRKELSSGPSRSQAARGCRRGEGGGGLGCGWAGGGWGGGGGRGLDLPDSPGEHRDDVAAVVDASLLPRGGTASARLALAWSSHRLLLWNAGARCHGSMPHNPAAGARNVPSSGPGALNAEPTCGSPTIDAGRRRQAIYTNPEPPVGGLVTTARGKSSSDDRLGSRLPLMSTRARAPNSRPPCG